MIHARDSGEGNPSPRSAPPSNPTNGRPRTPAGRGAIPGSRGRSRAGYDGSLRPTRGGSRTPRRGPPSHSLSPPGGVTRSAPVAAHTGPDAGEPWQRNRVPGRPLPPVGVPMGPRAHGRHPPGTPPAGGAVQSMFGPPLRGRISGLPSAHGECPRILLQACTPSNKEPRFVVRPPAHPSLARNPLRGLRSSHPERTSPLLSQNVRLAPFPAASCACHRATFRRTACRFRM